MVEFKGIFIVVFLIYAWAQTFENETCDWDCDMKTSFVNDFGMLCENEYQQKLILSFVLGPHIFGALIAGQAMDTLGRRNTTVFFGIGLGFET